MSAKVIVVTGPTASGKTELLDGVFARGASSFSGHAAVISADAMQAYRGMDIGTAKPERALLERLPHYLIDIKNPDEQYTAGEFVRLADERCAALSARGIVPVISGGPGFCTRNFVCGAPAAPPSDPETRRQVARDLAAYGPAALRDELRTADPALAARIAERDLYRLTRAVEILRASGQPPSTFAPKAEPRAAYEFLILGVDRPRNELRSRIRARVASMFASGLADEVAALQAAGYGPECPGLKAIGYSEFFELRGAPESEIAAAIELHTAQYAKRQMTFLRALPGIRWIPPEAAALRDAASSFIHLS
ncbi:tRNA (adenosine(37)-N6)-dimethylallyltransferase MiaA [bacterium]|nr:tRNA (adenosine(37)-N6)-dimethylallyltransferase MiaA [bacterium]